METTTDPNNRFHFETWRLFHPIFLIFCVPVTLHYILVLRAIRKLNVLKGFYFIFFLMGISDVYYLFSILACNILHYTDVLPEFVFVFFVVCSYFGVFFNILSNCLLSINRLCATCISYNSYFDNSQIKLYFLLITVSSIIATLPGGALMSIYLIRDYGLGAQYDKTGVESFNTHRAIIISMMLGDALIGVLTSLCTIYRLKKYNIKYDRSLLLVTILHIFPDLFVSLFNIDMVLQYSGSSQLANEWSRIFSFFLVSFNSLTIVGTNRMIRRAYLKSFLFWRKEHSSGSTISTNQSAPGADKVTLF